MLVRESLYNFKRQTDPIQSSGLGKRHLIEKFLEKYNITNYEIDNNFLINSNKFIYINDRQLRQLPNYIQFNKVEEFNISRCELTTLRGAPYICDKFICDDNNLTSLEFMPKICKSMFSCQGNHNLTSLNYMQNSEIEYNIDLGSCDIHSLQFLPKIIEGYLCISGNKNLNLSTINKNQIVNGDLYCDYTPLGNLTISEIQSYITVRGKIYNDEYV